MTRLLVDGNGLVCKLWWANTVDTPARLEALVLRLADENGATPCVAWDHPGPTWRHELMPAYKSNRRPKPEALIHALSACQRVTALEHLQAPGYEADDILATLAREAVAQGGWVLLVSQDKDLAQLVGPRCVMLNGFGGVIDEDGVAARWGVPPDRMRHLLSWMGDTSDGLPGVRGVGPVKAIPHALAGEIGDPLTYALAELATVPQSAIITT